MLKEIWLFKFYSDISKYGHVKENAFIIILQIQSSKCHYANMPMQYTVNFAGCKEDNFNVIMIMRSLLTFSVKTSADHFLKINL